MDQNNLPEEVRDVPVDNMRFKAQAESVIITDQASYDHCNRLLKDAKSKFKIIIEKLEPKKQKAYGAYKEWINLIDELTGPLKTIEIILKKKIGVWLQEQERIRQKAIDAAKRKVEEQRLADAEELEKQGCQKEAEKIIDKPMRINEKAVAPAVQSGGSFTTTRWSAEVVNIMALIKAVAEGKAPVDCLLPNTSLLNKLAIHQKEKFSIPGVKAISKTDVSVRI